ncbi:MAG: hypothetical protein ACYSWP_01225 [Planctomycetota bacterium]
MCRQVALHVDRNGQRRRHLRSRLVPLGFSLHKANSASEAYKLISRNNYQLVLLNFHTLENDIFDLCKCTRTINNSNVLMVLMSEVKLVTEKMRMQALLVSPFYCCTYVHYMLNWVRFAYYRLSSLGD